ncbi:hypothetical protein SDC9_158398 [bioreactor metagenome]|uniref:Uncharacterized protein n=1 Tax=bioreactor metagenome TaxID=1076179 RepID=A0A645FA24_9ZZZZ
MLQVGQTSAGGGRGDVLARGGAGDGVFFHHRDEQAQGYGIEFHAERGDYPRPGGAMPKRDGSVAHQRFALRANRDMIRASEVVQGDEP